VGWREDEARDAARRGIEVIERHLRLNPADARAYYLGSGCHSELGNREFAQEWARKALEISPRDGSVLYNVACTFIHEGLVDEALDLLERAVGAGWGNRAWLEHDPDMDPIRDHPRFCALFDRIEPPPER
jgi:adenylate cyclase